jgi:sRNA-binding regulator protein Hfq
MVVVLRDGEQLSGTVEWYDKHAFRLTRLESSPVMIYKHNIKYMFKAE